MLLCLFGFRFSLHSRVESRNFFFLFLKNKTLWTETTGMLFFRDGLKVSALRFSPRYRFDGLQPTAKTLKVVGDKIKNNLFSP